MKKTLFTIMAVSLVLLSLSLLTSCGDKYEILEEPEVSIDDFYTPKNDAEALINLLLTSNNSDDLLAVASSEEAAPEQLEFIAYRIANSTIGVNTAKKITMELYNNKNSTDAVMKQLALSEYSLLWYYVANSKVSSRDTLEQIANKVRVLGNDNKAESLARDICKNTNCDEEIKKVLLTSDSQKARDVVYESFKNKEILK